MRGYAKSGAAKAIRDAGGAIFALTSEPQRLASEAQAQWELDFPCVGDPHHEIAEECRERGWLHLFVNRDVASLEAETGFASHPRGFFQPGVLALAKTGRVLYRWRGRPTRSNAGGATHRPAPEHVWEQIRAALAKTGEVADAPLDTPAVLDMKAPPRPLFLLLLLGNGKFLRAKPFPLSRTGVEDIGPRSRRAVRNIVIFAAAWAAAFVVLPATWVLATALVWAIALAPVLVKIHRHFQSVPQGEPS